MTRIIFLVAMTALAQVPASLAGRWRSMETSKGGIGAMFEFRNDGTFVYSPGAVVEMKYRIEGNRLILPPGTVNGPELIQTMEWASADRLVLKIQTESTTLSRQGKAPDEDAPILGEWTTPREMSGRKMEARYLFAPDGKVLFLLPFTTQTGKYSLKGSTIRIEFADAPVVEGPFRVDGDVLVIPGPRGGGESRIKRY